MEMFKERVMLVSDFGNNWSKRVVFFEKNGRFFAWNDVETIEDAAKIMVFKTWKLAKEIPEKKKVLSIKDIAKLLNCSEEEIEIV